MAKILRVGVADFFETAYRRSEINKTHTQTKTNSRGGWFYPVARLARAYGKGHPMKFF
jgi:hypothetical protein